MAGKTSVFVSAILGISLYSKNPFIYRTCFGLLFFFFCNHTCYGQCCKAQQHHHTPQRRFPGITGLRRTAARRGAAAKMHSVHGRAGACPEASGFCPLPLSELPELLEVSELAELSELELPELFELLSSGLWVFFLRGSIVIIPCPDHKIVDGIFCVFGGILPQNTFYRSPKNPPLFCAFCNSS